MNAMSPASSFLSQVVETTDVDQVREIFAKTYSTVTLEPEAKVPFGFTTQLASCGAVHIATDRWSSGARLATSEMDERYIAAFPTFGVAGVTHAGEEFVMAPDRRAVLFSPKQPSAVTQNGHFGVETVIIDRKALEAHWTNLTGQRLRGPIQFSAQLDITQVGGAAVFNMVQLFRREIGRVGASRLVLASLRDALFTTLLTAQPHSESVHLGAPPPRVTPGCVRRVEEYIMAHATKPITLEELVAVAGAPARSLQRTFKQFRGTTPMGFLRQVRFELAHQRLRDTNARTSILDVVNELGLGHAGRFAVEYKQRFGEKPSDTLARAGRR